MGDVPSQISDLERESNRNRITFLRTEIAMCFTLIGMAETEQWIGNIEAATRSIVHAEEGYSTLARFLSDPKHAKHITAQERSELTAGMQRIREKLDGLKP